MLTPQHIIYTWATHAHADLYRNERLVLLPELRCLACNASLGDASTLDATVVELRCRKCGIVNGVGTALGHRVAVRLLGARTTH